MVDHVRAEDAIHLDSKLQERVSDPRVAIQLSVDFLVGHGAKDRAVHGRVPNGAVGIAALEVESVLLRDPVDAADALLEGVEELG